METLSFAFGVITVLGLAVTSVVIVGIVKVFKMEKQIQENQRWNDASYRELSEQLSNEISIISNVIGEDRTELNDRIDEVYRCIDSRFDKFENKFNSRVESAREILNDSNKIK